MDDERFDGLVRMLGRGATRRGTLGALLGVGAAGVASGAAAKRRRRRKNKKKNRTGPVKGCGNGGACLVFITSQTYDGNLGGLTGADAKCQARSDAADLPGTYKAWLADATETPATRFARSTGPYQLVDGTKIADSWDDLTGSEACNNGEADAKCLDRAINLTESGEGGPGIVWTHVYSNGGLSGAFAAVHCSNWSTTEGGGDYGDPNGDTNNRWTYGGLDWGCANASALYCFQQS